jgi:hypothetical protein
MDDIFRHGLKALALSKKKKLVLLGVAAVCWAILLSRNNVAFQRSKNLIHVYR